MTLDWFLLVVLIAVAIYGFVGIGSYKNPLTGKREWYK